MKSHNMLFEVIVARQVNITGAIFKPLCQRPGARCQYSHVITHAYMYQRVGPVKGTLDRLDLLAGGVRLSIERW